MTGLLSNQLIYIAHTLPSRDKNVKDERRSRAISGVLFPPRQFSFEQRRLEDEEAEDEIDYLLLVGTPTKIWTGRSNGGNQEMSPQDIQ